MLKNPKASESCIVAHCGHTDTSRPLKHCSCHLTVNTPVTFLRIDAALQLISVKSRFVLVIGGRYLTRSQMYLRRSDFAAVNKGNHCLDIITPLAGARQQNCDGHRENILIMLNCLSAMNFTSRAVGASAIFWLPKSFLPTRALTNFCRYVLGFCPAGTIDVTCEAVNPRTDGASASSREGHRSTKEWTCEGVHVGLCGEPRMGSFIALRTMTFTITCFEIKILEVLLRETQESRCQNAGARSASR